MPRKYYNSDYKAEKAQRNAEIVNKWKFLQKSAGVAFDNVRAADYLAKLYNIHSGRITIYRILREGGVEPLNGKYGH